MRTDASDEAARSNTRALQSALREGGCINLADPGTYYINGTLIIYSNTKLVLAPQVIIKELANTNTNMLVSSAYTDAGTAITVAWASGFVATVTWTAHGKVAGDVVWLSGLAPSQFNGVFRVLSSADANTLTVQLNRLGATITDANGTGRAANTNISIEGGTWDFNSQPAGTLNNNHAIILGGVQGLRVTNLHFKNVVKYCLNIGACTDFELDGIYFDETSSDGLKGYGPLANGMIQNIGGNTGDDMMSLQTREPDAFSAYRWTEGDIHGVKVRNVFGQLDAGAGRLFVLYGSDNEWIDNIELDGVSGGTTVAGACPVQLIGGTGEVLNAGRVSIRNVSASSNEQQINVTSSTIQDLEIDGLSGYSFKSAFVAASTVTIARVGIRGVVSRLGDPTNYSNISFGAGTVGLIVIDGCTDQETVAQYLVQTTSTTIDTLTVQNCDVVGGSSRRFVNIASGAIAKLRLIGNNIGVTSNVLVLSSGVTGTPQIEAYGNQCDGGAGMAFLNLAASCRVAIGGNNLVNAANGLIRTSGTPTLEIRSDGTNKLQAGSFVVVPSGTPVITLYGWDIAVDPIALTGLATTNGQYILSTQATTEGGPSVKTAAGWVALGTGSLGVNTVIS